MKSECAYRREREEVDAHAPERGSNPPGAKTNGEWAEAERESWSWKLEGHAEHLHQESESSAKMTGSRMALAARG